MRSCTFSPLNDHAPTATTQIENNGLHCTLGNTRRVLWRFVSWKRRHRQECCFSRSMDLPIEQMKIRSAVYIMYNHIKTLMRPDHDPREGFYQSVHKYFEFLRFAFIYDLFVHCTLSNLICHVFIYNRDSCLIALCEFPDID